MNDATSKPINLGADLGNLRRAAASTVKDSARLVTDTVVQGAQCATDGLAELRDKARTMGLNGVTAVRESGQAVAQHPVVFGLTGAALVTAGWVGGRNEDKIVGAAKDVAARVKSIPGQRLAKDAGLVILGAGLSTLVQHACKTTE